MKTVCEKDKCTGCMACIDSCKKSAISIIDDKSSYNAVIDTEKCVDCGACERVCQNVNTVVLNAPIQWTQGWAKDLSVRAKSSSGGFAAAISDAFIGNGGCVASCTLKDGRFCFEIAYEKNELSQFVGSKYVKSNPEGIYRRIRQELRDEKKVLFIGLPCQVAAVKKYIGESLTKNLYTIDLICHGTPSPKLLEQFLAQYKLDLHNIENIQFRAKSNFQVNQNFKNITVHGTKDAYTIGFLNGLIYTENCYDCMYATQNRCSDLTLGDSWGSELSKTEQEKGISLAICSSEKGRELLAMADLHLADVDVNNAISNNKQLANPYERPEGRTEFFEGINKGKSFNFMMLRRYPKQYLKQKVKALLIALKLIRVGI